MRIYAKSPLDPNGYPTLVIHHDDASLEWYSALLEHLVHFRNLVPGNPPSAAEKLEGINEMFRHINTYWSELSETKQANIFSVYKKMDQVFEAVPHDVQEMRPEHYQGVHNALRKLVRQLYELMPAEALLQFWKTHYPASGEHAKALDDFAGAAFSLRPLVVVFSQFDILFRKRLGVVVKEIEAHKLISQLGPDTTDAMARVREYISATVRDFRRVAGPVPEQEARYSDQDFYNMLVALVSVRRFTAMPLGQEQPDFSPVAFVYKFIGQKVRNNDPFGQDRSPSERAKVLQ